MNQKISIIVLLKNQKEYLEQCLESIVKQSYSNFEVLLLNNGLGTNIKEICLSYLEKDHRFSYLEINANNRSSAYNVGIHKSTGEYLTFIDSDDWIEGNYLEVLIENLRDHKTDMVITSYKIFETDQKYYLRTYAKNESEFMEFGTITGKEFIEKYPKLVEMDFSFSNLFSKLYRRDLIEGLLFDEELMYNEDLEFNFRVYRRASNISFVKIATYVLRNYKNKIENFDEKLCRYQELLVYKRICEEIQALNYANIYYIQKLKKLLNNVDEVLPFQQLLEQLEENITYPNQLISIIIPIYKVEEYLRQCLESVEKQTYPNFEVLLVNDGSPDNSEQICLEFVEKDARFKYIQKENGGLSDARNRGIIEAKGEYITFIDSDDYVEEFYVEELYSAAIRNHSDVVLSRYKEDRNGKIVFYVHQLDTDEIQYSGQEFIKNLSELETQNLLFITSWGNLYHRRLFNHILFPKGKVLEDLRTSYKLFMECTHVTYVVKELYIYRNRPESITKKQDEKLFTDLLDGLLEKIALYSLNGLEILKEKEKLLYELRMYSNQMEQNEMGNTEICRRYKEMLFLLERNV